MRLKVWHVLIASIVFGICMIVAIVRADYEYNREIGSYWSLSDKASTLDLKSQYLNKFVEAVEAAHLSGNNAIWFKTPDNSYDNNLTTLKSLQSRMNEIKGMDVQSFQYQQAISQITAQEQGEANDLLDVFNGLWFMQHHPILWDWIGTLLTAGSLIVGFLGLLILWVVNS